MSSNDVLLQVWAASLLSAPTEEYSSYFHCGWCFGEIRPRDWYHKYIQSKTGTSEEGEIECLNISIMEFAGGFIYQAIQGHIIIYLQQYMNFNVGHIRFHCSCKRGDWTKQLTHALC